MAANLKEIRRNRGLTQEKLAEMANVSIHYVSMIETCNKYPKPEMVERLAKILGVESYKLFSVEDETNEPLERLHQSIINDMRIIVREAVNEIKAVDCKSKKNK